MEWHQIENFVAVAQHKHFTKAAKERLISQPALSRSILKLEGELRVPLFIREGKNVRLTRYGEMFLKRAKQAQNALHTGVAEIQEKISPESGEISIAFLHTLGTRPIPEIIADYKKLYPNVTFQMYQGANIHLLEKVKEGLADICLTSPPILHEQIEWTRLNVEPLYLTVSKNHPFAQKKHISFKELENEEFICFKEGYGLRYIFDQMCETLQVYPKITFMGEEIATILGFVATGLGIAILPKVNEFDQSHLHFLEITDYPCERTIALATARNHYLSPAARTFKEFIIEHFRECIS